MLSLKHKFTSAKVDGPDSTLIRPSNWNAEHDLIASTANVVLGRITPGEGPVEELPLVIEGVDPGTMWTAAKVAAAIAAAIAAIPVVETVPVGSTVGWYSNSLPATGRWLFVNGQTIGNAGSGANAAGTAYEALYAFLWGSLTDATAPMLTSTGTASTRGGSAAADWAALKRLTLPDECGRVSAGSDVMGGVVSKDRLTIAGSGLDGDVLGLAGGSQAPEHDHTGTTGGASSFASVSSGGGMSVAQAHTHPFTTAKTAAVAVQPTIIKNQIIRY